MTNSTTSESAADSSIVPTVFTRSEHVGAFAATDPIPPLNGELVTSGAGLAFAASDLGNFIHAEPAAVLRPGSVADIARMVAYCSWHGIPVAARGEGHMTHGQAQVSGGLVIDMTTLNQIHSIGPDSVDVDAGALWSDVVPAVAAKRLRAVCLTGYLELTVGGTLSAGGISASYKEGAQIDMVKRLQVVTGEGEIEWCSPTDQPELFYGALGGLGLVGVITRAVVDLVPLPMMARTWYLPYTDGAAAVAAMLELVDRRQVDELFCMVLPPSPDSPPIFLVHVTSYYEFDAPPDDSVLLHGLPECGAEREQLDLPYLEHVFGVDQMINKFRAGDWDTRRKPWWDVFLGAEVIGPFATEVVESLTDLDWSLPDGGGFVLLFPHLRDKFSCPRLRIPDGDVVILFDILNVAPSAVHGQTYTDTMLRRNLDLWERARALGGVRYPVGSLPVNAEDWKTHYGNTWSEVVRTRHRYDPAGVLVPGHGIAAAIRSLENQ